MEACLTHCGRDFDINGHVEKDNSLLDSTPFIAKNRWQPKPEILAPILEDNLVWDPGGFIVRHPCFVSLVRVQQVMGRTYSDYW